MPRPRQRASQARRNGSQGGRPTPTAAAGGNKPSIQQAKNAKNAKQHPADQGRLDDFLATAATRNTTSSVATARGGGQPRDEPTEAERNRAIVNVGNTCFMSVVLVLCLYAVPGFEPQAPQWDDYEAELDAKDTPATDSERDAKFQEFLLHEAKFESTLKAYLVVRDELLNAVDVNARRKALTSLRSEFNATKQQEDAQQFLLWLANGHPLFSSVRSVTLRCTSCDAMQTTLDKDAGLWLEPKPGETLKDCFMRFAQGEHVDRNCTICSGSRAQRTDAVLALPPIMVFQLKQQRDARSQSPLQFPTELSATDLRPLTTNEPADMELIGVVFYRQYGRERGHSGHYTVACAVRGCTARTSTRRAACSSCRWTTRSTSGRPIPTSSPSGARSATRAAPWPTTSSRRMRSTRP